jgi:hypothetical protein
MRTGGDSWPSAIRENLALIVLSLIALAAVSTVIRHPHWPRDHRRVIESCIWSARDSYIARRFCSTPCGSVWPVALWAQRWP